MSRKGYNCLNDIDRRLRQLLSRPGPDSPPVACEIKLVTGFELFNTSSYHNYETFSDGWYITVPSILLQHGLSTFPLEVRAEDLDDAVAALEVAVARWTEHPDYPYWVICGTSQRQYEEYVVQHG